MRAKVNPGLRIRETKKNIFLEKYNAVLDDQHLTLFYKHIINKDYVKIATHTAFD